MSKADCHHNKADRCAQVCKSRGWVPPTDTCCMQVHTSYHIAGFGSFPRLFSAALIKGGFLLHSSQPLQVSWGGAEWQSP